MKIPQPFQYQGSKRILAPIILQYFPKNVQRVVEPFSGSAAISIACAAKGYASEFWLNDFNKPLAELLKLIVSNPEKLCDSYADIWCDKTDKALENYYRIREDFNRSNDPSKLLYLLARCVKGAVRYNADGLFNQSPDKRRLGTHPETMRENIFNVHKLLGKKTTVTSFDYREVLKKVKPSDIVYMDPPYQGVCGDRDSRYYSGIAFNEFVSSLEGLNKRSIDYLISYDGRLGNNAYGEELPVVVKYQMFLKFFFLR